MTSQSIDAYDLPARVATYDANMELMHPSRARMVEVALDFLPFAPEAPLKALDLGTGTGYFAAQFLRRFPHGEVFAVEGAAAMIDLAKVRFGDLARRVTFAVGDFRGLTQLVPPGSSFDVVFSSFALHHLRRDEKRDVARQARELLREEGWFLNADIILAASPGVESRIQQLRVEGIVRRAAGVDDRFGTAAVTRAFLDDLEAKDGDQPQNLATDLDAFRRCGLQERRGALVGAPRGRDRRWKSIIGVRPRLSTP